MDRLGGITDHADLLAVTPPEVEERLLQRADILVFVDDQVAIGAAHGVGHLGMVRDEGGGAEQDVFEIDPGAVTLGRFVACEDPADRFRVQRGKYSIVLGGKAWIVVDRNVADLSP